MSIRIPTRSSGPTGLEVSELALGSWHTWNRASFDDVVETVRIAVAAGVTFFDVGVYDDPHHPSDTSTDVVLARAVHTIGLPRDAYRLAAKGWLPHGAMPPAPLRAQQDALLRRHGTDHADVLVLGDLMVTMDDFTPLMAEVKELIDAGTALAWAVNNWSAADIARATRDAAAIGLQPPDYVQHKYGFTRRAVPEGRPCTELCETQGLTIQASDTFEGGLIFGAGDPGPTRRIGGDIGGTQGRIRASVTRFREAAASLDATVAQLAIAFPLTNPHTSSVLVGSRTPSQTRDNLGAFDLLRRHSPERIREVVAEFWFDRDVVSPDASWGASLDDDPATYVTVDKA